MLRGARYKNTFPLSRLALGKTPRPGDAQPRTRITHTITYPPARSMLPRNRLELIDRPSPPDEATTLPFGSARARVLLRLHDRRQPLHFFIGQRDRLLS